LIRCRLQLKKQAVLPSASSSRATALHVLSAPHSDSFFIFFNPQYVFPILQVQLRLEIHSTFCPCTRLYWIDFVWCYLNSIPLLWIFRFLGLLAEYFFRSLSARSR
jgi:hypothetical protein